MKDKKFTYPQKKRQQIIDDLRYNEFQHHIKME